MDGRDCIFSALRYGEAPDAVLVTYGIQGAGYFRYFAEHFDTITRGVRYIMGYVWPRHVPIYRRFGRGRMEVTELFRGRPYGVDGPEFVWLVARKL